MVILDTCAVIELFQKKPTFSTKAFKLIETRAHILSISFAEIACKVKLGKLALSVSTRELFQQLSQINEVEIVDVGVNQWLDSIELIWHDNKDPADRLITAFAIKNEGMIVTSDQKIKKFYQNVIW